MIASIIPIKRLPRHLSTFDYSVPPELEKEIRPGQLVIVPFRKSTLHGLVLSTRDNDTKEELKPLESIVIKQPLVSLPYLQFLERLAALYHVSLGTIAKMVLLPMQKRKLSKLELTKLPKKKSKSEERVVSHYSDEKTHADMLNAAIDGVTLILVPEARNLAEVEALLPDQLQDNLVVWSSALSTKQKFERWVEIRNGEKQIILGTRGASLLPIPNLKTIIIDFEHDENHKHWDQAPRFHAKDVARLRDASLHYMSFSPSAESYYAVHKELAEGTLTFADSSAPTVISMKDDRRGGHFDGLADKTRDVILSTKEDIFLYLPKKGFARVVLCDDCAKPATCRTCALPMIYTQEGNRLTCNYCKEERRLNLACTQCGGAMLTLRGRGTEALEKEVRELMKDSDHEIVRIDSAAGEPTFSTEGPRVIIGTQMAFQYVRWEDNALTVFVDADAQLRIPEYGSEEEAWHHIAEVQYRSRESSEFLLQTFTPSHLVYRSLTEPDRFYRTHLNLRRTLDYPPYTTLVRYFYGHPDAAVAKKQVERLQSVLQSGLTEGHFEGTLGDPIEMHPRYFRGKFWYSILVRLPIESWKKDLPKLNRLIPSTGWKVDPNPISILSP